MPKPGEICQRCGAYQNEKEQCPGTGAQHGEATRREMNVVQQRAAAHGNLALQKGIVEQRDHRLAQQ